MQSDQAANELTEEQVPNFLINIPDEQIDIELGENADIDSENISSTSSHSRSERIQSALLIPSDRNTQTSTDKDAGRHLDIPFSVSR